MNGNKEIVSFEELLLAVNFTQDALIMLLEKSKYFVTISLLSIVLYIVY